MSNGSGRQLLTLEFDNFAENLYVLWPAAQQAFAEMGRGAVTVDTTVHPPGKGHPFYYLTHEQVNELGNTEALRLVSEYDPTWELVAMLLKLQERVSTYRIGVPGAQGTAGTTQP